MNTASSKDRPSVDFTQEKATLISPRDEALIEIQAPDVSNSSTTTARTLTQQMTWWIEKMTSLCTAEEALAHELKRADVARKMREEIEAVLEDAIARPFLEAQREAKHLKQQAMKKNKKCTTSSTPSSSSMVTSSSVTGKKLAIGMFPALVFEGASLNSAAAADAASRGSACDPLLPHLDIFPDGVAQSIAQRLTPHVHDYLRLKDAALSLKTKEVSQRVVSSLRRFSDDTTQKDDEPHFATSSIQQGVQLIESESHVSLVCGDFQHSIRRQHYVKLQSMYTGRPEDMLNRMFTMLHRYYALTGCVESPGSEAGWHGSVPPRVMATACDRLGVAGECFASPLNAVCLRYCSAFPDVDCFFGSIGSFFDTTFVEGVLEANPPFEHATVVAMSKKMMHDLNRTGKPLGFLVVLPWCDKGKELHSIRAFEALVAPCVAATTALKAAETPFVDGYQQCCGDSSSAFTSRLDSRLILLQHPEHPVVQDAAAGLAAVKDRWKSLIVSAPSNADENKKRLREEDDA